MLTAASALALFVMLAISSVSLFIAQRLKIPHTVFLAGIGIVLAWLATFPLLGFVDDLTLTPELLFYIFLPTLIFESAYNINIRHLTREAGIISILSIISLCVSAFLIAFGLDFVLTLVGLEIPFILSLVFGAIISATDPVAVLALFKEYGAPRRLSLIFEGESIFNDGTGVALFLVVIAIAESGVYDASSILSGSASFLGMVIGGIIFGLLFGGLFTKLIEYTRSNEFASITLTMVLAHTTFICAEIFSHHAKIGDAHLIVSPIIATAVASLLMGNYGRYKLPVHALEFVEKYWSHFAFIANSLIFILIGMLVIDLPENMYELIVPILLAILIVATARAISIYPVVGLFNIFARNERKIPRAWQHVLAWGSLRGALAVTMVLLIPDTFTVPGWEYSYTPKEFILALTVSCVFATLFIKATTIGRLMHRLNLSTFTRFEEINYRESIIHIYTTALKRLKEISQKGYIRPATYDAIHASQVARIQSTLSELEARTSDPSMLEKVIRLHAIGIERKYVRSLFAAEEISETTIRRIVAKLEYQSYAIEHDQFDPEHCEHGKSIDIFEYLADAIRRITRGKPTDEMMAVENYLYYRALAIISRKVVKELHVLDHSFGEDFKVPHNIIRDTIAVYEGYREGSTAKLKEIEQTHSAHIAILEKELAYRALYTTEAHLLHRFFEREMVTPKVSIALSERLIAESAEGKTAMPHSTT